MSKSLVSSVLFSIEFYCRFVILILEIVLSKATNDSLVDLHRFHEGVCICTRIDQSTVINIDNKRKESCALDKCMTSFIVHVNEYTKRSRNSPSFNEINCFISLLSIHIDLTYSYTIIDR
jgi:hypothetical protein